MDETSRKIIKYRNFLSVSNLMNLFLTGEFKQCKTGKRVLEDYLKNYNQFNQGLGFSAWVFGQKRVSK